MRRALWTSVIGVLAAVVPIFFVAAEETVWGGRRWYYYPSDNYADGLEVSLNESRAEGHVDIPDYIDGLPVVDVLYGACIYCVDWSGSSIKYVTSVRIPETVRRIGPGAFGGQIYLKNVVLPRSLETIGAATFQDCPGPFSFKGNQPRVDFPSWSEEYSGYTTPFGSAAQAAKVTVYFVDGRAGWVNGGKWYGATTKCYPGTELVKGVRATQGIYSGRVRVSWNAVSGNTKGYDIYRTYADVPTGAYQFIGNVGRNVTAFDDTTSGTHTCIYVVVPAGFAQLIGAQNLMATGLPFNTANGWAKVQSLSEALGSPDGEVTTGGDENWVADVGSVRSGVIKDSMSSWLELTVDGTGRLEFDCKVSSETSYDKLSYRVDGEYAGDISGDKGWIHVARIIDGPKKHVVRWTYSKDQSVSDGMDCGWLRNVKWSPVRPHEIRFDANGGSCEVARTMVTEGVEVGNFLPQARRDGFVFLGWYTARSGGARVLRTTRMVAYDVVLYAHWETIAPGACSDVALPFAMTSSVQAYGVSLVREWLEDDSAGYDDGSGALYCTSTLKRGSVYTMAVPHGVDFDARCDDPNVSITRGADDSLSYCRLDTRGMAQYETRLLFVARGDVGQRTTVYAVESDYQAFGSCEGRAIRVVPGSSVVLVRGELHPEWSDAGYLDAGVRNYEVTLNRGDVCTFAFLAGSQWSLQPDYYGDANDVLKYVQSGSLDYVLIDLRNADLRAPGSGDQHLPLRIRICLSGRLGALGAFYHCLGNLLPKPMRNVRFEGNGGVAAYDEKAVRYGDRVGALPGAERLGYSFDGWYTAPEGGMRVAESTVMVDYDVTLYAHWTPRRYKVTFVSQGRVVATRTVAFMSPLGDLPVPSAPWDSIHHAYMYFHGWWYGDQLVVSSDTIMSVPSDITLTAGWGGM